MPSEASGSCGQVPLHNHPAESTRSWKLQQRFPSRVDAHIPFSQVLSSTHACSRRHEFFRRPPTPPRSFACPAPTHLPTAGSGTELHGLGTSGLAGEGWATQPSWHLRTHMSGDRLGRQREGQLRASVEWRRPGVRLGRRAGYTETATVT